MFGVCSSVLHICLKTFTHRCLVAQNRFRSFCIRICGLLFWPFAVDHISLCLSACLWFNFL